MDSRSAGTVSLAFALGWRVLLAAGLSVLLILAAAHYYATALVLAVAAALSLLDAARILGRARAPVMLHAGAEDLGQARELHRLAALLDAVTVALIAVTPNGRIRFVNRAARLIAGEEVGWLGDIRALGAETAAILAGMPVGARRILTIADGSSVLAWTSLFTAPEDGAQKLISLQQVTGQLDAVQLKAWQDMLRVLSHEIMNSLTPISSLSESVAVLLRERGEGDERVTGAMETIGRRSAHLLDFVERYRAIANLPAPRPRDIALDAFMKEIAILMVPDFTARGIVCQASAVVRGLTLRADPDLLSQAVINLLRNAAEAVATSEKPTVTFSCQVEGDEIVFRVSDNGDGLPPEMLEEIFVPFFTTKLGGSGIGLTLARQIAEAHGGRIQAVLNPERGATFRISFPIGK